MKVTCLGFFPPPYSTDPGGTGDSDLSRDLGAGKSLSPQAVRRSFVGLEPLEDASFLDLEVGLSELDEESSMEMSERGQTCP